MRNYLFLLLFLVNFLLAAEVNLLSVTPTAIPQGNSVVLKLATPLAFSDSKIFFEKKYYSFYRVTTENYRVVLGTDYLTAPGTKNIEIKLYNGPVLVYQNSLSLVVKKQTFRIATLVIDPSRKEATNWSTLAEENAILGRAFRLKTPKNYCEGKFVVPCKYLRISSEYGVQRIYKMAGKVISHWGHKGIDFSNVPGVVILAANSGKVVVSKNMKVHGKTIAIDHGQGIISTYNHLSQRFVKPGDFVKKGEPIGRIGLTGLITGAHLHFGLSVNNVRVNPQEWFTREF